MDCLPHLVIDFVECSFLREGNGEISKHQQLSSKNLSLLSKKLDYLHELTVRFLLNSDSYHIQKKLLQTITNLRNEKQVLASKIDEVEIHCDCLSKEHQELPHQVAQKRVELHDMAQNLDLLKIDLADLIQDTKQQQKSFKANVEATKLAKLHYKDYLGCYVSTVHTSDDYTEFIFSYSKTRPLSLVPLPLNSIKCQLNRSKKTWKLIEANPALKNMGKLALKLEESQDIQGLLVHLRPPVPMR